MPRVPQYDQNQTSITQLPNVRQNIATPDDAFGAGQARDQQQLGQGLMRLGSQLSERFMAEKREADKIAVLNADTEAERLENALTYGDSERKITGYSQVNPDDLYGPNADKSKPLVPSYSKQYDAQMTALRDRLANDDQKRAFDQIRARRLTGFEGRLSAFESKLVTDYKIKSGQAVIETHANTILANYNDPTKVAESLARIEDSVDIIGAASNMGQEQISNLSLKTQSAALTAAVSRAIDNEQPELATNILLKFGDRMTAEDKAKIEGPMQEASLAAKAQDLFDKVAPMGQSSAVAFIRKNFAGKEEEKLVDYINGRFNEQDQIREAGQRRAADAAWNLVAQGKRVPPSLMASLDGRTRKSISDEFKAKVSGANIKTDWDLYSKLRDQARENPQDFAKTDIRQYFGQLAPSQRETLLDMQDKLSKSDAPEQISMDRQISALAATVPQAQRGKFQDAANRELQAESAAKGRKLNFDERQKVLDRLMLREDGGWFGTGRTMYQVYGTADAEGFTPKITDDERKKIESTLRRKGLPVTDKEVERLFRRKYGLQ